MDGGGDGVVGALLHVDVIVGVDGFLAAALAGGDFVGAAGDHLVGVHVGRGSGSGLEDVDDELVIEFAIDHFLRGLVDQASFLLVQ